MPLTGTRNNNPAKATAREIAMEILIRVEQDQAYSNLLLNQYLHKYKLERLDAGLVTEIVYGTIQRLNTIDYFLGKFVVKGMNKLEPWVRSLLRLSFYQMYYLERIPAHAVVNEAVNLAKKKGHQGISGMVNGILRNVLRQQAELVIPNDLNPTKRIALLHSHPEWLVSRWIGQYGEETTEQICQANNMAPHSSVRVNPMKHTVDEMMDLMQKAGLEATRSQMAPQGIVVGQGGNLAHSSWFTQGDVTIQDESSMLVAEMLNPEAGMQILDCCAAPGGKSTHLAEKMRDTGRVIACDIHEHKEKLIRETANRLNLHSIQTIVSDALLLPNHYAEASFDAILVDAPCSGLGVIRRKPDLKWSKQERDIEAICQIQLSILEAIDPLLRPGGVLVYSTCTIEFEENQAIVAYFMKTHPQYELEALPINEQLSSIRHLEVDKGMLQILPHHFHSDGFFIARLRKKQ